MTEEVVKDESMELQKQLIGDYFKRLCSAEEQGLKTAATFVPGNLAELLQCFDVVPILPEINAILEKGLIGDSSKAAIRQRKALIVLPVSKL